MIVFATWKSNEGWTRIGCAWPSGRMARAVSRPRKLAGKCSALARRFELPNRKGSGLKYRRGNRNNYFNARKPSSPVADVAAPVAGWEVPVVPGLCVVDAGRVDGNHALASGARQQTADYAGDSTVA